MVEKKADGRRAPGKKRKQKPQPVSRTIARQKEFARHFLAFGTKTFMNAYQSALAAGYSKNSATTYSCRLVDNLRVREEMRAIRDRRAAQSTIAGPEEILETLTAQMRTTPEIFVDEKGALIPLKAGEKDRAQAIAGLEETTRTIMSGEDAIVERKLKYKLIDRQKAAVELGRAQGVFEKDNAQTKPDPTPISLVAMPSGPMTLEEWTKQAQAILNAGKQEAAKPAG